MDLSQLISKYIGETQKNIGKVFDKADRCDCILLFDEADAIFTRRSDVSDAQDRVFECRDSLSIAEDRTVRRHLCAGNQPSAEF
ncbi:MAG: AAA family ATPase [Clostridia bacterium]